MILHWSICVCGPGFVAESLLEDKKPEEKCAAKILTIEQGKKYSGLRDSGTNKL